MLGFNSYFCQPTYNMCNPTPWNMATTLWNQQEADVAAKFPTYCVYNMSMPSSFSQFYSPINTDLNTVFNNIMQNTMLQYNASMQNGGLYGYSGPNLFGNTSTSTTDSNLSSEEKSAKSKFLKLQKLISTYRNKLEPDDDDLRANIDTALKKNSKDTYVEAFDKLKEVYDEIKEYDEDGLRKAITLIEDKVVANDSTLVHDYQEALENGGYDYSDNYGGISEAPESPVSISDLHSAVLKPQVNSTNYNPSGSYYSELALSTSGVDNNILAILGQWNNKYGTDNNGKERSIIRVFANKVNKVTKDEKYEKESRMEYLDANMKPFVDALRYKGEYAAKNLKEISSAERTAIKELAAKLNTDYEKLEELSKKKSDMKSALNTLVDDFEELYVALRLAEAKNSQKSIQKDYNFMEDIKDDNFIVDATMADLKREGFTTEDINDSDVSVTSSEETSSSETTSRTGDSEETGDHSGDEEEVGGDEEEVGGDEEIEEYINPDFNAKGAGQNVRHLLSSWTTKGDATIINNKLQSVNSTNVLEFLDGYYEKGKNPIEGLIEKLDDDASPNVTMETKLKLLKSILKKAEELGLDEDDDVKDAYNTIKEIVSLYETDYSGEIEFNKTYSNSGYFSHKGKWASVISESASAGTVCGLVGAAAAGTLTAASGTALGAAIGAVAGCGALSWLTAPIGAAIGLVAGWACGLADRVTDNEVLDDAIQKLYQKMREE